MAEHENTDPRKHSAAEAGESINHSDLTPIILRNCDMKQ
uniref:Uncharacterized protein n=1 Tax=Anguilla anguilla TaxID=7936 RepID=A0A0E9TGS9_ANGAN